MPLSDVAAVKREIDTTAMGKPKKEEKKWIDLTFGKAKHTVISQVAVLFLSPFVFPSLYIMIIFDK